MRAELANVHLGEPAAAEAAVADLDERPERVAAGLDLEPKP